jgi:DNA-binding XRE family transcriptional regulator
MQSLFDPKAMRTELGLSQSELADLLGVSIRTIQSCEQGWRQPSPALERAGLLALLAHRWGAGFGAQACWEVKQCSAESRQNCLPYVSRQGHLCWFLTGNACEGKRFRSWKDKKSVCVECAFFQHLLGGATGTTNQAAHSAPRAPRD